MKKTLNLNERLDFNDIDLTAPNKVIEEILSELPRETKGIVLGMIKEYSGPVTSYIRSGFASLAASLGTEDEEVNIQEDLGAQMHEEHRFECFLYTPLYDKYKYRLFFVKYGIANYPVEIILEESIAQSISGKMSNYINKCNNRAELEELIINIFTSKKSVAVMQELIRINQAKKMEIIDETNVSVDIDEE